MLESQEIPGVTPIQQKEALEADSIPHGTGLQGQKRITVRLGEQFRAHRSKA